jgi:iron complex outermembrane receptor protein
MRQPVRLFTRIVTIAALLAASSATQAQPTETEGEEIEPLGAAEEGRAWEAEQQEQEFEPVGPVEEEQKRLAEKEEAEAEREEARKGLEEIVVTATKRAEVSQDVPISLTALSGRTLKDAGLTEFSQLNRFVPNLRIAPATDTRSTSIRIRGIGSVGTNAGIDPSVGVFIDGVYQGRAGMSVGDLLDIERIEVLRGPQGTLFGKNTAAGAISIVTKRPIYEWETFLEAVVGNYNNLEFRGSLNIPIVEERVAARIAGYKVSRDGYDTNLYNGEKVNNNRKYGVRGKFVFDIDEEWSLLISGDFSEQNDTNFVADIISYEGESRLRTNFDRLSR